MADWNGKVVLITGGSRGLGLAIARAFGKAGSQVVLWSRDAERSAQAQRELAGEGLSASAMIVDVTSDEEVSEGLMEIRHRFGRLDVLVNAVGKSTRIGFSQTTVDIYRDFFALNVETAIRCSLAALELLSESDGHLVNIGSLSAKIAWPFMAPYTASKFALAGFTQQLRLEGPKSIHVMLVCPGPIRRDDAGERYRNESGGLPDAAARPGAGAPVKGLDPRVLAQKIVRGCARRQPEIVMPSWLKLLFAGSQLSARLGDGILKRVAPSARSKSSASPEDPPNQPSK